MYYPGGRVKQQVKGGNEKQMENYEKMRDNTTTTTQRPEWLVPVGGITAAVLLVLGVLYLIRNKGNKQQRFGFKFY